MSYHEPVTHESNAVVRRRLEGAQTAESATLVAAASPLQPLLQMRAESGRGRAPRGGRGQSIDQQGGESIVDLACRQLGAHGNGSPDVFVQRSAADGAGGNSSAADGAGGDSSVDGSAENDAQDRPLAGSTCETPASAGAEPGRGAGAGGGGTTKAGVVLSAKDAPASAVGQAKLTTGVAGDRYEQEADAVADQVVSHTDSAVQRKGFWKSEGFGSRAISGPTGVQLKPDISSMGGAPAIQRMDPDTIEARAAVVELSATFAQDIIAASANDITYSFDRMNGTKNPHDNINWSQLDQSSYPWRAFHWDLGWYWGRGETGMKVRIHWEGNGFSINGVHITKRTHDDEVQWGAVFGWLVQNLNRVGTNGAGYPKSIVRLRGTGTWESWICTQHGSLDGWIDAEGQGNADITGGAFAPF